MYFVVPLSSKLNAKQTRGGFVEQKLVLSCSFRCDRINKIHYSRHTLFYCLSPT